MANKEYKGFNKILRSSTIQAIWDKMNDGTIKEFFDDWKWIFSFSKKYWLIIVFYTILGLVSSSLGLTSAYMAKELINIITEKQQDRLWILIAVMLGSAAFSLLFSSVMSRISTKISIYVNNDIQGKIFDEIIDSEWAELRRYSDGDLLNRFTSDVNTVAGNAIGWIPSLVINIYTFAVTFVVMVRMDSIMALIAFLSAPFLLLMSRFILRRLRKYRQDVLKLSSDMMSFEVETFSNFDMIKSFGIIRHYSKELRSWQKKYKDLNLDYNKFEIKANIMMSVLSTMVSMVAFFYCLFRLWKGQILFGDMTFFLQQRSSLSGNFNSLVKTFPTMVNSAVSAHRIRELVELQKEEHNKETLKKLQALAKDGISVEMQDASFFYDENQTIYEGGSFVARPGEIVAVLGSSGEGKTTLLRLFLGLLHPQSGSVTLRGADGEAIPVNADLRQLFSYVPQGNTVLSGTIAENMRMVKPDATDEEIVTALQTACAWEFVEKLPNGINSVLGDNGRGISVGQGQRISIARSLLRDSPILMLDEATSALDVETEQRVLHNIIRNRPNKTCIVSTHRPSVLNLCQRIYRIGDQKIEEVDKSVCEELQQMFTEG